MTLVNTDNACFTYIRAYECISEICIYISLHIEKENLLSNEYI